MSDGGDGSRAAGWHTSQHVVSSAVSRRLVLRLSARSGQAAMRRPLSSGSCGSSALQLARRGSERQNAKLLGERCAKGASVACVCVCVYVGGRSGEEGKLDGEGEGEGESVGGTTSNGSG